MSVIAAIRMVRNQRVLLVRGTNAADYRRHMQRAARNRPTKPQGVVVLAVAGAALGVAVLAAWLMAPKESLAPLSVQSADWFDQGFLQRAEAFRSGQRWLFAGQTLAQLGLLLAVALGPLAGLIRKQVDRAAARPGLAAALVGASILLALQLVALPFSLASHERAVDAGLSVQDFGGWFQDWLLSTLIFVVLGTLVLLGALWLARRFGSRWWIPGTVGVVLIAVLVTWAAPSVLSPLFNDYEPIRSGPVRQEVLGLARETGVDVGGVYRVDASRRTTGINAFVDGIGSTKRVVLYDTLIEDLTADQRRSVVAHELAHAERNDVWRGLLWVALVSPFAVLFTSLLADRLSPGGSASRGRAISLPALILSIALSITAIQTVGNGLSRAVEMNADLRALQLTDAPRAQIALQRRLAKSNLIQPDPPGWSQFLLGTHPTTDQRIGLALAWERERGGG